MLVNKIELALTFFFNGLKTLVKISNKSISYNNISRIIALSAAMSFILYIINRLKTYLGFNINSFYYYLGLAIKLLALIIYLS